MIKVNNVTKTFGNLKALSNLNLHVRKGSIYGLVGPNGSGKTTIINNIVGVYKPDEGEVLIGGEKVLENDDVKQKVGYIQDDLFYFNQYTIKDMAKFYKGIYKNFDEEKFESLGKIFKIETKRRIKTLSKGMKKQVGFWLVLSCNPEVIVLDEPLDGLDPIMRRNVLKLLIAEVEKRDVSVLVSSHNLRELEDICDTVGIMNKGQMLIEKKLDELITNIHKVQIAFNEAEKEVVLPDTLEIKAIEQLGKVKKLIIKGNKEEMISEIEKLNPILFDVLPLSLEEVFIYEVGGDDIEVDRYFN